MGHGAMCSINPDLVQILSMSKVCPISVQIIFFIQKLKMRTLITFSQVQYLTSVKKCNIFDFLGHSLDNLYSCLSKCLGSGHILDWVLTGLGQWLDRPLTWPVIGLTLDWTLTGIRQSLDRTWIFCPTSVQPTKVQLYRSFFACHKFTITQV